MPTPFSPVHRDLKFSAVRGTIVLNSWNTMRPAKYVIGGMGWIHHVKRQWKDKGQRGHKVNVSVRAAATTMKRACVLKFCSGERQFAFATRRRVINSFTEGARARRMMTKANFVVVFFACCIRASCSYAAIFHRCMYDKTSLNDSTYRVGRPCSHRRKHAVPA